MTGSMSRVCHAPPTFPRRKTALRPSSAHLASSLPDDGEGSGHPDDTVSTREHRRAASAAGTLVRMRRPSNRTLVAAGLAVLTLATGFGASPVGPRVEPPPGPENTGALMYTDFSPNLDGADFDPGDIISDAEFFDSDALGPVTVQAFLSVRARDCSADSTCLADYVETTRTIPADPTCDEYVGRVDESAATIISRVGSACGVNPAALLTLLQKEQSLVTDTAPTERQYRSATGYGCPDTADCDSDYYGFFNQVYNAASQFRRYTNPAGTEQRFTWYPVGETTDVRFSPDPACGAAPVLIENAATAGLYYYTPYQPNEAALANIYGSGDACSAYGNRNFWRIHEGWFGR